MLKPEFQERIDKLESTIIDVIPVDEEYRVIMAALFNVASLMNAFWGEMVEEEDTVEVPEDDNDLDVN